MTQSPTPQQIAVDHDVWLTAADYDYRVRVYRPQLPAGGPIFVWAHGGGWIGGDLEMPEADWVSRSIAGYGIPVVSVDYTLAPLPAGSSAELAPPVSEDRPRARYPVASIQLVAAFDWTADHAADLGGSADRIGIGGASAGGNLAASAVLRLRDRAERRPASAILIYPAVHAAMPPMSESLTERLTHVPEDKKIDPAGMPDLSGNYAGDAQSERYAFPGGHDATNLPRTLIVNADLDTLRPSGEQYAAEIARVGGDVRVLNEPGTTHGYLNNPDDPAAPVTIARMARWLAG